MPVFPAILRRHLALLIICLASACWSFSFGVSATLSGLWLKAANCSDPVIGTNTGTYYLGMAAAAAAVPWLMRRWGNSCTVAGMIVSAITTALFPLGAGLAWWFPVRLLGGMAGALSVIPLETYVNRSAAPQHRARDFACYAVALTLGYALGNWFGLELFVFAPILTFAVGGVLALIAAALIGFALPPPPPAEEEGPTRPPLHLRRNLLGYGSAWNQGFLEGVMIAFLSLYLIGLGMTENEVGWLTSLTVVGVLLFQMPVAWLADRLGRTPVLLGCYAMVIVGLGALPGCTPSVWLAVWLFAVGAGSGALYPLGLALLGERLPDAALARANAWYLAIECAGCMAGPIAAGCARDWFGVPAMFAVGQAALVGFLLICFTLHLLDRRAPEASAAAAVDAPTSEAA
jgi:MFS family permease